MPNHCKYNIVVQQFYKSTQVEVNLKCNGWVVMNKGTTIFNVNNVPLLPPPVATVSGESYGVAGNSDEIYMGRIDITMPSNGGFAILIQKVFTD